VTFRSEEALLLRGRRKIRCGSDHIEKFQPVVGNFVQIGDKEGVFPVMESGCCIKQFSQLTTFLQSSSS
jgi:hypothetical protein